MRSLFVTVLAGVAALAAAAAAQPSSSGPHRDAATLCLDALGENHVPVCTKQDASRFAAAPDICVCNGPYRQVEAPWCAKGEVPPGDTADFEHARAAAAQSHSSLFGATYQGKRMCVPLGN